MVLIDFTRARKKMVKTQLEARGVGEERVLRVMGEIPREEFVPRKYQNHAYDDGPLPIGEDQTISQPYVVALMTQLLKLEGGEKVLEVGTGSGYQTAILSKLAGKVYSLERKPALLKKAKKVFDKLELKNIETKHGDGSKGWLKKGPFEAIIVTAAAAQKPEKLIRQLADGGRLAVPLGTSYYQRLIRYTKKGRKLKREDFGSCVFVPLIKGKDKENQKAK